MDADKLYQDALNQINGVQTPDIEKMKLTLQQLVQQGAISPEKAQAALTDKNAFNEIQSNPMFQQAQQSALSQLQEIGQDGGMTPVDRAQLANINNEANTVSKGRQDAIMQNAQERGISGSGLEMAARLGADQSSADRASQQGLDVAAQAQQRALAAIQGAGQMGSNMQAQQFGEQATKAQSQNAIDAANTQMANQFNMYNNQMANNAQAQNLGERQRISDTNAGTVNNQNMYNSQLHEQDFQNQMAKAGAAANVYGQWGNSAAQKQAAKTNYQHQLQGGLINAGAKAGGAAVGGPMGAAAAPQIDTAPQGYSPNMAPNQTSRMGYAHGGVVPGKAPFAGDSPKNDIVDAKLSPGEVVIPRSEAHNPDLLAEFHRHSKRASKTPKVNVGHEDIAKVFKALSALKGGM